VCAVWDRGLHTADQGSTYIIKHIIITTLWIVHYGKPLQDFLPCDDERLLKHT
jgi:hypothetical protein